jgi:ankyrin repeat protein
LSNGSYIFPRISPGDLKLYKESLKAAKVEVMEDPRILAMALALLDRGANPNASDKQGTTAIMYPAQEGNEEVAKALLDKGADVHAKNAEGESVLFIATENGHAAVAALLINNGADVNEKNPDGLSILETAIDSGRPEMVKLLLAAGAELHPEVLVERAKKPGALSPESLGHMDQIKILETAVAILKSENVDKQNKIETLQNQVDKLVDDVLELKTEVNPGFELLSGN